MTEFQKTRVWNFDLPPFPRNDIWVENMSDDCQVNRLLKYRAVRMAQLNQLDASKDPASFRRWQKTTRAKLWKKLGSKYDASVPLDVQEFGTLRGDGFSIRKMIYQSRPGIYVTSLLYVPDGKGPFPAVLEMHGHSHNGKFYENYQLLALDLVKSGFVCLLNDSFGSYERARKAYLCEAHGAELGASLFHVGESLMGCQIVDNMRAIDFLRSLPIVKKDKIGAVGASGGGNQTMWLSAMDERVAAAMPIVSVGSFESYVSGLNCMCEVLRDGMTVTTEAGVLALIAPRALRVGNALYDANHDFSPEEMLKTFHAAQAAYWQIGHPDQISYEIANRTHGMTDLMRQSALGFFTGALKGIGNGNSLPEPDVTLIPEEKLHLFASPEDRPEIGSLHGFCRKAGEALRKKYLARKTISASAAKAELRKMLRMDALPALKLHRYAEMNGAERAALEVGEFVIPFLVKPGTVPGKFKLMLHPNGKAYWETDMLRSAAADGSTLVLPDLFYEGETAQQNRSHGESHQPFRQLLWLGKLLAGEWTLETLALIKMLKRDYKASEVSVFALKSAAPIAIFANVLDDSLSGIEAVDAPASYLFDPNDFQIGGEAFFNHAMFVPDFLLWGDVSLAAALGNAPVSFVRPRTASGVLLDAVAVRKMNREIADVRKKLM